MGVPTVTLGAVKSPRGEESPGEMTVATTSPAGLFNADGAVGEAGTAARPRLAEKEIDKESVGRLFTAVAAAKT
jgi:hypothetical protein